jgi:hypothetical protein
VFDVPQLLSEIPFRNSANRTLDIVANAKVMLVKSASAGNNSRNTAARMLRPSLDEALGGSTKEATYVHKLEVKGPLLPTMVPRLLSSLLKCQRQRVVEHRLAAAQAGKKEKEEGEEGEGEEGEEEEGGEVGGEGEEGEEGGEKTKGENDEEWLDFTVDLRPCPHSFGHNVINDILVLPTEQGSGAGGGKSDEVHRNKKNGKNSGKKEQEGDDEEDDEGEPVERLSRATIVKMDLSSKIVMPAKEEEDQKKKTTRRRVSRGRKKVTKEALKKQAEDKEKEIRIRYLTKEDPSNRVPR